MADRMTILLIAGYVGALALGAYELQRAPFVPPPPPKQGVEPPTPLQMPVDDIESLAAYDAIIERPLFRRDRQPATETSVSSSTEPRVTKDEIAGMRLAAVLKGVDILTALLEDQTGKTKILHQGDQLGGWRIDEILDDSIVVVSGERKETLLVHRFDPVSTNRTSRRRPLPTNRKITRRPSRAAVTQPSRSPEAVQPTAADREPSELLDEIK
jgi:hypothetical protein